MYVTDSWHIALMVANRRAHDTGRRQRIQSLERYWLVAEVGA